MSSRRVRLRALLIVSAALGATALPTVAAFAAHDHSTPEQSHSTPREEIQPCAHILGELARKSAQRTTGQPLGIVPEGVESRVPHHAVRP